MKGLYGLCILILIFCVLLQQKTSQASTDKVCADPVWCNIPMPTKSYYRFDPPSNEKNWQIALQQAASGEHILLKKVREVFPNQMDFLDGDVLFRVLNEITDLHVDMNKDFTPLLKDNTYQTPKQRKKYHWEAQVNNKTRADVIPRPYDLKQLNRSPVVLLGYHAFERKEDGPYYTGPHIGEAIIERPHLYEYFHDIKNQDIHKPFILVHGANENWGILSIEFPNRTANWGSCCIGEEEKLNTLLNHPQLLLMIVTQHHNITHSKLLTLPRGIALNWENKRAILYDLIHILPDTSKKQNLLFTASSTWKHRPYISKCIQNKFVLEEDKRDMTIKAGSAQRSTRADWEYHRKLAAARMGIALPGLGYDTYRLWETMTMGTVPVIEKGIGLDKTLWRLPALLVEDFDEVTPTLLRVAYVEALYRANAGQFEFERLTQSFWYSLITNASTSMSAEAVTARFPPESEDPSFARPLVPYQCGERMQHCGPGTKRTPRSSCPGKPVNNNKKRAAV